MATDDSNTIKSETLPEKKKAPGYEKYKRYRLSHRAKINANQRKWRAENPDKVRKYHHTDYERHSSRINAYTRKKRKEDPERIRGYEKKSYQKHKESKLLKQKCYRKANDKVVRERNKKYRETHPEAQKNGKATRRARESRNIGRLPRGHIKTMLSAQGGKCAFCYASFKKKGYHLDHIVPISKGGTNTPENVQLLCPSCNLKKGAKSPDVAMKQAGLLPLI